MFLIAIRRVKRRYSAMHGKIESPESTAVKERFSRRTSGSREGSTCSMAGRFRLTPTPEFYRRQSPTSLCVLCGEIQSGQKQLLNPAPRSSNLNLEMVTGVQFWRAIVADRQKHHRQYKFSHKKAREGTKIFRASSCLFVPFRGHSLHERHTKPPCTKQLARPWPLRGREQLDVFGRNLPSSKKHGVFEPGR